MKNVKIVCPVCNNVYYDDVSVVDITTCPICRQTLAITYIKSDKTAIVTILIDRGYESEYKT